MAKSGLDIGKVKMLRLGQKKTYREMSEELDASHETIRAFCIENGIVLKRLSVPMVTKRCPICNFDFQTKRSRDKTFCSRACGVYAKKIEGSVEVKEYKRRRFGRPKSYKDYIIEAKGRGEKLDIF